MDIRSVMTPDPAACQADSPVREVARLMLENDIGLVPVIDAAGRPVGTVTDRDIALRVVAEGRDPQQCTAQDCMTSPVTTVSLDTSLADAIDRMEAGQIRRLLVVDTEGRLCGVVAQADVALSGRDRKTAELLRGVSEPKH
ncbi:CBS domain-containing protein [Lysobacter xinjiangensis]|jgi:CBS domain-containing protein|uniref:CBS domain-containing protein n=1 Tax=Cognatilysobacter xinjiangensis TaxID=546892 RepID=A0ABQ3BVG1_9GAMM|nr:CBS domain-containing protein [Lysobacter xinjiangensis]GGZ55368.1 CBS domain-containing protein [Lysobacter xinjiangensis]